MFSGTLRHQPYQIVNIIFMVMILSIFTYSAVFPPDESQYPLPSFYNRHMTQLSPTTGLSHSFSALIRGQFRLAQEWNPFGIPLFLFFLIQLILRGVVFISLQRQTIPHKKLLVTDIILSSALFICCYGKLLLFWKYF